jgi:uncharacterized protein
MQLTGRIGVLILTLPITAYTTDCIWRNRDQFIRGPEEIKAFLTKKFAKEQGYRLKKELFAFQDNKIVSLLWSLHACRWLAYNFQAVQFFYEFHDEKGQWFRAYGLEDWTFQVEGEEKGKMRKRMSSINDVKISEHERWFANDIDVESVVIDERHL